MQLSSLSLLNLIYSLNCKYELAPLTRNKCRVFDTQVTVKAYGPLVNFGKMLNV